MQLKKGVARFNVCENHGFIFNEKLQLVEGEKVGYKHVTPDFTEITKQGADLRIRISKETFRNHFKQLTYEYYENTECGIDGVIKRLWAFVENLQEYCSYCDVIIMQHISDEKVRKEYLELKRKTMSSLDNVLPHNTPVEGELCQ